MMDDKEKTKVFYDFYEAVAGRMTGGRIERAAEHDSK